jgi:hypothetical protein
VILKVGFAILSPFCRYTSAHFAKSPVAANGDWHMPRLPLVGERHAYFYHHIKCGIALNISPS